MLLKVTSTANPVVKMLKSLHAKKGRAESGLFLAEGARLAEEAADLGIWPKIMAVSSAARERPQTRRLIQRAEAAGVRCIETSDAVMGQIAKRDNPQTVIGAYKQFDTGLERFDPKTARLWVALDRVRDPGNLGTILRTADAVGAGGVILVGQTCDPFSVETVRASMGAIFATPLAETDLAGLKAWRDKAGMKLIGTSLQASQRHDAPPTEKGAIVFMGNEQSGLEPEAEALCDELVRIPMRGKADSLNLAAATAVMLYDLWRRHGYDGAH